MARPGEDTTMDLLKRKRLEAVLQIYGADPARWPAADRSELAGAMSQPQLAGALEDARQIDRIMSLATVPAAAGDFEGRLMQRLAEAPSAPATSFVPPRQRRVGLGWAAALPIAASLLLGIYLGAHGNLDRLMPSLVTGNVASADDDSDASGADDVLDMGGSTS